MTQATLESGALLGPIEATLERLIWRARAAIALRGLLATLAAAMLGILLAMGIASKWLITEPWQHYALTCLWLGAGGAAAFFTLLGPMTRTFTLEGIARVVEARHPELHERLSSAVELLTSADGPELRGSEAMIHALARMAVADAGAVVPRREITFRKVRPFLAVFFAAALILAGLLAAFPTSVGRLLAKTLAPYLNIPNVYAEQLEITPGKDIRLPLGAVLEARVTVNNSRVQATQFRLQDADGTDRVMEMDDLRDGTFTYATTPLKESIRYRIRAGDAMSRYYNVVIVPRPALTGIDVGYEYPKYLCRDGVPLAPAAGNLTAPVNSVATVRLHANKPLTKADLFINDKPAELTAVSADTYQFTVTLGKESAGKWRLMMTDQDNFAGDPVERDIRATPDAAPTARITAPGETPVTVKPTDRLTVSYEVADDVRLSGADMLVSIDGQAPVTVPIAEFALAQAKAGQAGLPALSGDTALDLGKLDLNNAKRLTYQVRALDVLPKELGGPQQGLSAARTVNLDAQADSLAVQMQLAADIQIRDALKSIQALLGKAKEKSLPLRQSMPATKALSDQTTAMIDDMRKSLSAADAGARKLVGVAQEGGYDKLAERLGDLADKHLGKAVESADLMKITDVQQQRADQASDADFQVDRSLEIVAQLLKDFEAMSDLAHKALVLDDLARREQELADAKANKDQPDKADKEWQDAAAKVAKETADLAKKTPAALHEAAKDEQKQSVDLAAEADKIAKQQAALVDQTASAQKADDIRKALGKLAAAQQQLADDAARFAKDNQAAPAAKDDKPAPAAKAAHAADDAAKLLTTQPAAALDQQKTAADALAELGKDAAAAQLADLAGKMAQAEAQLAKQSQEAQQAAAAAKQTADAAQKAAADNKQVADANAKQSNDLADRQAKLADQAAKTQAGADKQPADPMRQAVASLKKNDAKSAADQAAKAADVAADLAKELTKKAEAAPANQADQDRQVAADAAKLAAAQKDVAKDIADATAQQAQKAAPAAQAAATTADAAKKADAAAQAANQRQAQAAAQQQQLAQQAPQLQQLAKQASPQVQQATQQNDPAANMQKAAVAMTQAKPDQAAQAQTESAKQLDQIAQAARAEAAKNPPADQAARTAAELATRQRQLQDQTADLARQLAATREPQRAADLARLAGEQEKIKGDAAKLADAVKDQAPQDNRKEVDAARAASEASKDIADHKLADAADAAKRAAKEMGQLARQLDPTAAQPHEGKPEAGQPHEGKPEAGQPHEGKPEAGQPHEGKPEAGQPHEGKPEAGQPHEGKPEAGQPHEGQGQPHEGQGQPHAGGESGKPASSENRAADPGTAQEPPPAAAGEKPTAAQQRSDLARQAGDLERQQERVAREIADIADQKDADLLASKQERIAEQTDQTKQKIDLLNQTMADLVSDAPAQQLAKAAADALAQARQAQANAAKAMAAGQPQQSLAPQQSSAQAMTQAASALKQLGQRMGDMAKSTPAPPQGDSLPADLADAAQTAEQAAQSQAASDAQKAAAMLAALSKGAAEQAAKQGVSPSPATTPPRESSKQPAKGDGRVGSAEIDPALAAQLKELGLSRADWAKLPGELRDQVLQAAAVGGPEEYRGLVKQYFQAIAKKGAVDSGNRSSGK